MRSILYSLILGGFLSAAASAQNLVLEPMWSHEAAITISTPPVFADINGIQEKLSDEEVYLKHPEIIYGAEDGKLLVVGIDRKPLEGWPVNPDGSAPIGVAVADLDNKYDGPAPADLGYHPEIVVATEKGALAAYSWTGRKLWTAVPPDPITRRPSLADVNGDGWLEVVTRSDKAVLVFSGRSGQSIRRIPMEDPGAFLELADLDGNGTAEIIASSQASNEVYALQSDGFALPGWPVRVTQPGAPIAADVDNDGLPEVVVPHQNSLAALRFDGTPVQGWTASVSGAIYGLSAGDVNRDGKVEIVLVQTKNGSPAQLTALSADGKPVPGFPAVLPESQGMAIAGVTIAPLDSSNGTHIQVVVSNDKNSRLYVVRGSDGTIVSNEVHGASSRGIALTPDRDRTLVAFSQGTKMRLFRAPERSAKSWAFDWPMVNRSAEGNCTLGFPLVLADQAAASPISVDLDGDGRKEILIGTGDSSGRRGAQNSRLYAIRANGIYVTGWPVQVPEDARSLTAADIVGDIKPEVILTGWDGTLRAWSADGKPLWEPVTPPDKPRHLGGAALADLNGDGKPEMVFGTMKSGEQGKIYAFSGSGSMIWQYPEKPDSFTRAVSTTPAVGDLDGDGKPEIVVTTRSAVDDKGTFYPAHVLVLSADGKLKWGDDQEHSIQGDIYSSPTLADLDSDGKLEIVFGSAGYLDAAGKVQTDGKLYVYDAAGKFAPGWPKALVDYGEPQGWIYGTPAVGDIDGDGKLEVSAGSAGTYFFDPVKGFGYNHGGSKLYAWKAGGTLLPRWPYDAKQPVYGSPIIADANGDGMLDVIAGSGSDVLNAGTLGKLLAVDMRGNDVPGWPKIIAERQIGTASFEARPLLLDGSIYIGSSTTNNAFDPAKGAKQGAGRIYRFRAH